MAELKIEAKEVESGDVKDKMENLKISEDVEKTKDDDAENEENKEEVGCAFCKKSGPAKRCAKRHPKCIKKLFCNETCENLAHKKKEDPAAVKSAAKKVDAKKKKDKKKNPLHAFNSENRI